MSENFYLNEHVLLRTTITCHALTRAGNFLHSRSRAMRWHTRLELWRHGWYHPPYPSLTCLSSRPDLTRTDLEIWPGPNRLKLFKKKKKWEKKMLWPSGPLTLTKKSKFSNGACPTQFFAYIPISESVSLFKTWKLCKLSKFQKVDFCTNFD